MTLEFQYPRQGRLFAERNFSIDNVVLKHAKIYKNLFTNLKKFADYWF